jgi:hypothetical protein
LHGDKPRACRNETFRVKLNPICPHSAKHDVLRFEDASYPILSVEARVPQGDLSENPMSNQQPYHSKPGPSSYLKEQARPTILLETRNLLVKDLFGPKFKDEITLDYSKITTAPSGTYPRGWSKILITVYVCNDTNRDGKCSDELVKQQLTLKSPVHQACHFPSAVPVDVWHCE